MATIDICALAAQLKKLTKDELINVIITKDVSTITALSEASLKSLNVLLSGSKQSDNCTNVSEEDGIGVTSNFEILSAKMSWLEKESKLLTKMNEQLEGRIEDQALLISLLREGRKEDTFTRVNKEAISNIASPSPSADKVSKTLKVTNTDNKTISPAGKSYQGNKPDIENRTTNRNLQKNHRSFIRGTGNISNLPLYSQQETFAAVARRAYLYVGNINPSVKTDTIHTYITDKFKTTDFKLEELPRNENALSKAFKLTIDFENLDAFNKPEMWPAGIIIKRFFRPKRTPLSQ